MATTPEELEAQRARVAELRQQIADHEREQAEKLREDAAEAEMLQLQAEEARLQADLAVSKQRSERVTSNTSALDAARERMRREQARLESVTKPVPPSTGEETPRDRSTQDEEFVDPDHAPKTPGLTETTTPTAEANAPATSPTVASPSAPERTTTTTARTSTSASGEGDK